MEKVFVKWGRPCIYRCEELRLLPGINKVNKDILEKAMKNPGFKKRVSLGLAEIVEGPAPSVVRNENKKHAGSHVHLEEGDDSEEQSGEEAVEAIESLEEFSAKEAKALIEDCMDTQQLIEWNKTESRKSVQKAIDDRLGELVKI